MTRERNLMDFDQFKLDRIPAWAPAVAASIALVVALRTQRMKMKLTLGLSAVGLFALAIWWQLHGR